MAGTPFAQTKPETSSQTWALVHGNRALSSHVQGVGLAIPPPLQDVAEGTAALAGLTTGLRAVSDLVFSASGSKAIGQQGPAAGLCRVCMGLGMQGQASLEADNGLCFPF